MKIKFFFLYLLYPIATKITKLHNFYSWFSIGVSHILNWEAYDHLLFLFALCCIYTLKQWKKTLLLITAFTIGHSVTLALSVLHVFTVNAAWVEFLIAVTIIVTCIYNIKARNELEATKKEVATRSNIYCMACVFGFIHGLGFASVLREMLSDSTILFPLFSFNIGIEAGQLIVVITLLLITQLIRTICRFNQARMSFFISTAIAGFTLIIAISRFTDIFRHLK